MSGEKDLGKLLNTLKPNLHDGIFVFCTVENSYDLEEIDAISYFREKEGVSLIIEKSEADKLRLAYDLECRWITLDVHSSLEAVGLTAAFSKALAQEGISCNVVAGFYHDHIFVSTHEADRAMSVLHDLSSGA